MAHVVKCFWCGERFDTDKIESVKVNSRRYGHLSCVPEGEVNQYELIPLKPQKEKTKKQTKQKVEKDKNLEKLEKYICQLFDVDYVPPRIQKQITQFKNEFNYTYSGILKTLVYFYEIQGNNQNDDKYGQTIGIVPWIYEDAKKYFYTLYLAQLANQKLTHDQIETKVVQYRIPSPQIKKRDIKLFVFEEEKEEE